MGERDLRRYLKKLRRVNGLKRVITLKQSNTFKLTDHEKNLR